jgi:hypothetical protein
MLHKHPSTNICSSWSPEEIEELRRSLRTGDVAEIDAFMFGKRFYQIISGGSSSMKDEGLITDMASS